MSPKDPETYYPKFLVIRPQNLYDAELVDPMTCFTLIPSHDPHAVVALRAYCESLEAEKSDHGLAKALRAHFDL